MTLKITYLIQKGALGDRFANPRKGLKNFHNSICMRGSTVALKQHWGRVLGYLRVRQLRVGMALASIGAMIQVVVTGQLGWQFWNITVYIFFPHYNMINYLAGFVQHQTMLVFILGVLIWFTEPTASMEELH